jgi:hypothetical protein
MLVAILPMGEAVIIKLKLFYADRPWKISINLLGYRPNRYTIRAELFTEKILMELY